MLFSHPKDVGRIVEAEGSREVKSSQQCLDQDFTPVCTTEIGACQVLAKDFQRRGVERSRDKSPQMLLRTRLTQCLRVPVPVMLWFREVQLIGLSCDSVEQHRKWAEVEGCQFFWGFPRHNWLFQPCRMSSWPRGRPPRPHSWTSPSSRMKLGKSPTCWA